MIWQISVAPVYVTEIGEDGPYTAQRCCVEAVSPRGDRFWHFELFPSYEEADRLAERVKRAPAGWTPEANQHWCHQGAVYGSDAWSMEDEHAAQRLDVEAEFGPDSYRPGGPGYLERRA